MTTVIDTTLRSSDHELANGALASADDDEDTGDPPAETPEATEANDTVPPPATTPVGAAADALSLRAASAIAAKRAADEALCEVERDLVVLLENVRGALQHGSQTSDGLTVKTKADWPPEAMTPARTRARPSRGVRGAKGASVRGAKPSTPKPARAASPARVAKPGRLARRSDEQIAAEVERVAKLLKASKDGLRSEQIRAQLGYDVREMPRILGALLDRKLAKTKGQKRATTYFAK